MSKFTNVASLMFEVEKLQMFEVEKLQMERDIFKAERDALLAELQKANAIILDLQRNPPKFTKQHPAEIRAEAGRTGYLQAIHDLGYRDSCLTDRANKYAEQIRQGDK